MNKILLYHQCGHNDVWNFDSFTNDSVGDGFILCPKMRSKKSDIETLPNNIRNTSFFDPQFYYPRSHLSKLLSYDFFPSAITDGDQTTDFMETANEAASKCVDFQYSQNFKYLIIPTRTYTDTPQNYLEIITQMYIEPFINALQGRPNKKILLTIVLKETQLNNNDYITDLLNLITRYKEIYGVYLVPSYKSSSKRLQDYDFIIQLMYFIKSLKENDFYVHVAYSDMEGLLYTLAGADSISVGTYENLRKFDLSNFIEKPKDDKRHPNQPNKRIYSNKLLQWIDINYIGALKNYEGFNNLFERNQYLTFDIPDEKNWHLKWPELYKHYLLSLSKQYKSLPQDYNSRHEYLIDMIKKAIEENKLIEEEGVLFNNDCNGSHLFIWATAINKFYKNER